MERSKEPLVILVDEEDNQTGIAGKMEAHKKAFLHRAVSVFLINSRGEWILQRRSFDKYHSKGLWTNACCTHPHPGESVHDAAHRRLNEEMGINCELKEIFTFLYKEKFDNDLTEHEFDHIFLGITDMKPEINSAEVEDWKAVQFKEIDASIKNNAGDYSYWFRMIYEKVNFFILQNDSRIKNISG